MDVFLFNTGWMGFNILLAIIPIIFGWLSFEVRTKPLKFIFLAIWLIFLPNTLYIVTDLIHIPKQLGQVENNERFFVLFQYFILEAVGLASFVLAIYPFEKMFSQSRFKNNQTLITTALILINILVGFGIVLGRIQRANSWEIFTNTEGVAMDGFQITSSSRLMLMVLFFGVLGNLVYFLFRRKVASYLKNS